MFTRAAVVLVRGSGDDRQEIKIASRSLSLLVRLTLALVGIVLISACDPCAKCGGHTSPSATPTATNTNTPTATATATPMPILSSSG
jgi:hypothetical protein